MKHFIVSILSLLIWQICTAQQTLLIDSGRIEFDKIVNMHAIFKSAGASEKLLDDYKKNDPQFRTVKCVLYFDRSRSTFGPVVTDEKEPMINSNFPFPFAAQRNVIFTDLNKKQSTTRKRIAEMDFLIQDSVRKINWKITDEFYEVAGFNCRRANALIMDSVYVVAFFTDRIQVRGGPESFTGLPGMILQVSLPHDHVTWRATVVTEGDFSSKLLPSVKGKILGSRELTDRLKASFNGTNIKLKEMLIKDLSI